MKFGWGKKSRILVGMANDPDGSVIVMDGVGPDAISVDPDTGGVAFTADRVSFSESIDAAAYSHLLSIQEE